MSDKAHFVLLIFFCLGRCWAEYSFEPKILGGRYAELGEAPYIVLITDSRGAPLCDGSIIRENWILTVRHCLKLPVKLAFAGFVDLEDTNGAQVRSILNSFSHLKGDIGLLQLDEPFDYDSDYVAIINLPNPDYDINGFLEIFGWGKSGTDVYETKLKTATLPFIVDAYCVKMYRHNRVQVKTERSFCAGSTNGDLGGCHGDSGGPLIQLDGATPILVGVVQGGSRSCVAKHKPTVFGRVTYYMDWIQATIEQNESISRFYTT